MLVILVQRGRFSFLAHGCAFGAYSLCTVMTNYISRHQGGQTRDLTGVSFLASAGPAVQTVKALTPSACVLVLAIAQENEPTSWMKAERNRLFTCERGPKPPSVLPVVEWVRGGFTLGSGAGMQRWLSARDFARQNTLGINSRPLVCSSVLN